MEEKKEFELIISQGKISLWRILVAALFFTGMIYYLYLMCLVFWKAGFSKDTIKVIPSFIYLICIALSGGMAFSITKTILIDVDKNKLISRYFVGPFSKDVLTVAPKLEYVAVYLDPKDYYQVNLWYKGNKHYKMYRFDKKLPAMRFGLQVANKLNIEVLDATERGNSKWRIDKTNI